MTETVKRIKSSKGFGFMPLRNFKPKTNENKQAGYYKYGYNDNLPNEAIEAVNNSGAAKRCINKVAEYIAADGFIEDNAATFMVNAGQTADKFLSKVALSFPYFGAAVFHISRNGAGMVAEVKLVANQLVRKTLDGDWMFNPTLDCEKVDKNAWKTLQNYVGTKATPEQLLENAQSFGGNGEILYLYNGNPFDSQHYAVPTYFAQFEDLRTASELSKMNLEAVLNGFMLGGIMNFFNVDDTTEDESGKTQRDYIEEAMTSFTGLRKNEQGLASRFGVWANFGKTKDEAAVYTGTDPKPILEASDSKADIIDRNICRWFGVHPVLVGYADAAVLGNTDAINQASKELNNNVNGIQRMISEAMKSMFPQIADWTITEFSMNQTSVVKTDVQQTLDALTSLSPLVANKVLESMTKDEIRALVALAPEKIEPIISPTPVAP